MRALALLLGLAAAAAGREILQEAARPPSCPDTAALRRLYRLGELEEVYQTWRTFFRTTAEEGPRIPRDCFLAGSRMIGILGLILEKDTSLALTYLNGVRRLDPRMELWDLSLPMSVQAFWDHEVSQPRERTDAEIWREKWLPPITSEPPASPKMNRMRSAYHSARLLYAQAMDPSKYGMISEKIAGFEDPAFTLLRADVALRMGEGPTRAEMELEKTFNTTASNVIMDWDAAQWHARLGDLVRAQQEKLQRRREDTVPVPSPPTLKVRPRGKR